MPETQVQPIGDNMGADKKQEHGMPGYQAGYARVMPFLFVVCKYHGEAYKACNKNRSMFCDFVFMFFAATAGAVAVIAKDIRTIAMHAHQPLPSDPQNQI